ncbi:AAA family ATPase [Alkaliphilus transvaalensis]|uniref:AAA family ATPase n=1 Tax=Alkaliphilus transvaalensis TaxID=114628 RepID=UPI0004792148|nr:AAA family ATPase [Alkaliphilus transvaalensis]
MINRIHILGASGSGTTTLAKALSNKLGYKHYDTDDFFWVKTDPPFQEKTDVDERIKRMESCLKNVEKWVLSGSLCGWGDGFIPYFDLVVFLCIPKEIRMERLLERERNRYGSEIDKDGKLYQDHLTFMDWASKYDSGDIDIRSRKLHYEWLEKLNCQVLKIEEDIALSEKILKVESLME